MLDWLGIGSIWMSVGPKSCGSFGASSGMGILVISLINPDVIHEILFSLLFLLMVSFAESKSLPFGERFPKLVKSQVSEVTIVGIFRTKGFESLRPPFWRDERLVLWKEGLSESAAFTGTACCASSIL